MKTVVATTTLYVQEEVADQIRFILACQMLEADKRHNYPTVVLDGSSPKMHEELKKICGDLVYPLTMPGMGPGRRLAFFYAKRIWQRDTYIKAYQTLAKLPKIV